MVTTHSPPTQSATSEQVLNDPLISDGRSKGKYAIQVIAPGVACKKYSWSPLARHKHELNFRVLTKAFVEWILKVPPPHTMLVAL